MNIDKNKFTFDLQRFDSAFSGGDGSQDNPYQIARVADMKQLSSDVNGGNHYEGKFFKLTADIDFSGVTDWTPIGTAYNRFRGTFDGAKSEGGTYKISNLTLETNAQKAGLFGYAEGATIKNLTLENFSVTNQLASVLAITGALTATADNATIENVTVIGATVTVTASYGYVGGLVGDTESGSQIKGCYVQAQVSGGYKRGAVVGDNYGSNTFENNYYASNAGAQGSGNDIHATKLVMLGKTSDFNGVTISGAHNFGESLGADVGTTLIFSVPGSNYYVENADKTETANQYTYTVDENSLPRFWEIKSLGSYSFDYKDNTYFIRSARDFLNFAAYVNDGGSTSGLTFKLDTDINLEGISFSAIQNFAGTLDGDGFTIVADSVPISGGSLTNLSLLTPTGRTSYNESGSASTANLYRVKNISGVTYTAGNGAELIYVGDYVYAPTGTTLTLKPDSSFSSVEFTGATANGDGTYSVNSAAEISMVGYRKVGNYTFAVENGCYLIRTAAELENLAYAVNSGNKCAGMTFKLANDIDLGKVAEGQSNHTTIGDDWSFSGTFDGAGFTIDNLTINSGNNVQGLFGRVNGAVKNVRLTNAKISGGKNVGGVVSGLLSGGVVDNCSVEGEITGSMAVGGVVGLSQGTIKNCAHSGSVSASRVNAGGIVGNLWDKCSVENCINAGKVSSKDSGNTCQGVIYACEFDAGVFANNCYYVDNPGGVNTNGATQAHKLTPPASYKFDSVKNIGTGGVVLPVNGEYFVSGDVNVSFGLEPLDTADTKRASTVAVGGNTYAMDKDGKFNVTVSVTGNVAVQIVGTYYQLTETNNSVTNTDNATQILGSIANDSITNSADNVSISGGGGNDEISNSGKNTVFEYRAGDGNDTVTGFDETSTLKLSDENGAVAKYTKEISGNDVVLTVGSGTVTLKDAASFKKLNIKGVDVTGYTTGEFGGKTFYKDGNTWLIATYEDLENLAAYVNGGNECGGETFKLISDIEMPTVAQGESNHTTIAANGYSFSGTFDGDGHTIDNLKISSNESTLGLFGNVYGTVKNLRLTNAKISGKSNIGGVVGNLYGTVENCYVEGEISGISTIGGVVGGARYANIKNCAHSGEVSASKNAGGIAGVLNNGVSVENCVNAGEVSSTSVKGVIFGYNGGGAISNCYYLDNPSNVDTNGAVLANATLTVPAGLTVVDGGAQILDKVYTQTGATVQLKLDESFTAENILFVGVKGATPKDGGYSYKMPETGDATITENDFMYFLRDETDGAWLISSARDLESLAAYVNGGHDCAGMTFKLANNINLGTVANFTPIGTYAGRFKGTFDGNGKKISNLTINTDRDYAGLFGYAEGATIKNLTLTNANVQSGGQYAGALAGRLEGGEIADCNVVSTVNSATNTGGGLAGAVNNGAVKNCVIISSVTGGAGSVFLSDAASTGSVLISNASDNDSYERYYALNIPTGITAEFAEGAPSNSTYTAFDGKTYYRAGTPMEFTLSESYTDPHFFVITGLKDAYGYEVGDRYVYKDFTVPAKNDYTIEPVGLEKIASLSFDYENEEYLINSLEDFIAFVEFAEKHETTLHGFRLTTDLNLSSLGNFKGIGVPDDGEDLTNFNGRFDGGGHTISGLTIFGSEDKVGLFREIGYAGLVQNLNVTSANVSGGNNVGIIAGKSFGNVRNCNVTGTVNGSKNVGGVVGDNAGGVLTSSVDVQVTGSEYVGGLVGYNTWRIENNSVKVSGTTNAVAGYSGSSWAKVDGNIFELVITGEAQDFIGKRNGGEVYGNYFVTNNNSPMDIPGGIERVYKLTLPAGAEIISGAYKFDGSYYAQAGATVTIKPAAGDYLTYSQNVDAETFTDDSGDTQTTGGTEKIFVPKDAGGNSAFTMPEGDTSLGAENHAEISGLKYVINGGDGYYEIGSSAELNAFLRYLKANNTGAGETFKITAADITADSSIGAGNNFAGTLDGGGYTVNFSGAILTTHLTGTIKNLNLLNGGFARTNDGTITNSAVVGTSGNDSMVRRGAASTFKYVAGEGNDTISNFNADCVLKVVNADDSLAQYSKTISGANVVVKVGENTVTLKDAAKLGEVNIEGYPTINGLTLENGVYLISSNDGMNALRDYVNGGGKTAGLTFRITKNGLTLRDGSIGTAENPFRGTFDGGGYKVRTNGVNVLFGNVEGATIQNLKMATDISVDDSSTYGGLVNTVQGSTVTTIQNVELSGGIFGKDYNTNVGGVVGLNAGNLVLTNVVVSGKVYHRKGFAGGFVAECADGSTLTINDSIFKGSHRVNLIGSDAKNAGAFSPIATKAEGAEVTFVDNGAYYVGVEASDAKGYVGVGGTAVVKINCAVAGATVNFSGDNVVEIGGEWYANAGAEVTATFTANDSGYTVGEVKYGGTKLTANNGSYTFTAADGAEFSAVAGKSITGNYTVKENGEVLVLTGGAQTITIAKNVREVAILGMGEGDTLIAPELDIFASAKNIDGGISIRPITIYGIQLTSTKSSRQWIDEGNGTYRYHQTGGLSCYTENGNYIFNYAAEKDILRISGVKDSNGLSVTSDGKIKVAANCLADQNITLENLNDSNYKLEVGNGVASSAGVRTNPYWRDNGGGSYSYVISGTKPYYTGSGTTQLTYHAGTGPEAIKITGAAAQPNVREGTTTSAILDNIGGSNIGGGSVGEINTVITKTTQTLEIPAEAFVEGSTVSLASADYIDTIEIASGSGGAFVAGENISAPINNNCATAVTVKSGSTLNNYKDGATIFAEAGSTVRNYSKTGAKISGEGDIWNDGRQAEITLSNAKQFVNEGGTFVTVHGSDGNDTIENYFRYAPAPFSPWDSYDGRNGQQPSILAGAGNDYIYNSGSGGYLYGEAGNDTIVNDNNYDYFGFSSDIYGGDGDDSIVSRADSTNIDGGENNDYIYTSGASPTIKGGTGNDTIVISKSNADKTVTLSDFSPGDVLVVENFYSKYRSADYTKSGDLQARTRDGKKLTIKGIGKIGTTSGAGSNSWAVNNGVLYYGKITTSSTTEKDGTNLNISYTFNSSNSILEITGATGTPQIENNYLVKFKPENFVGDAEVRKNSQGYRYKFESGDYGGKTVKVTAPTAVFSSASNINLDMSNGSSYATREIYISGGDNVTVSSMNDGFIKIAQNVKKMTLTVTGMNEGWSDIRFEGGISSYTQTMDGVLVNGNILIKGTNLQQSKGWQVDDNHSATLSAGTASGLVMIPQYGNHYSNGYDRLRYEAGSASNEAKAVVRGIAKTPKAKDSTITLENENFIDSDTAVTVANGTETYSYAVKAIRKAVVADGAATLDVQAPYDTITGSNSADSIKNQAAGSLNKIYAGGGADVVDNYGASVTVDASEGADTITNYGKNSSLSGGDDADKIYNYAASVTIDGGTGSDTVQNFADSVTIDGGAGTDSVTNTGSNVFINGGNDADKIWNYDNENVTLDGSAGNDDITNYSSKNVLIRGGSGSDELWNMGANSTIIGGAGGDTINNTGKNVVIYGGSEDDSILNVAENVTINAGDGQDTVWNYAENVVINLDAGQNTVYSESDHVTINFGAKNATNINKDGRDYAYYNNRNKDVLLVGSSQGETLGNQNLRSTVKGGGGNDVIWNNSVEDRVADFSVIDGGAGNDSLWNNGNYNTLLGGDGNDTITNKSFKRTTIDGGKGNDIISSRGEYSSISGGAGDDSIQNDGGKSTILGGEGADTILNNGNNVLIDGGAGNDLIQTYTGATIRTGDGADTISVRGGSTELTLTDFGADDVIVGLKGALVDAGENAVRVGNVILNGVQQVSAGGRFNDKNQLFATTLGGGVYLDGEVIRYAEISNESEFIVDETTPLLELSGTKNLDNVAVSNGEVTLTAENFVGDVASIKSIAGDYTVVLSGDLTGKTFVAGGGGKIRIASDNVQVSLSGGNNVLTVSEGVGTVHISGAESTDKIYFDGGRWVEKDLTSGAVYVETYDNRVTLDGWTKFSSLGGWLQEGDSATLYTKATMSGARWQGLDAEGYLVYEPSVFDEEGRTGIVLGGIKNTDDMDVNAAELLGYDYVNLPLHPKNFGDNGVSILGSIAGKTVQYHLTEGDYSGKVFYGSDGGDVVYVDNGAKNIIVNSGSGNDTVSNSGDNAQISLGAGNDTIYSNGANANINGGAGNDTIQSHGENAFINGGEGNNFIEVGGENSRVYVSEGNNTIVVNTYNVSKIHVSGFGVGDEIRGCW